MQSPDMTSRLELAVKIAREAGDLTLEYFNRDNFQVEIKSDDSPVTIADKRAEQHLRARIAEHFPEDGVLGEEFGEKPGTSGCRWILDPIDGTKSFIHGVPLYGTLIGIEAAGRSAVGVIRIPPLDECVYAAVGSGTWYVRGKEAPRAAHVGTRSELNKSLFCTSEVEGFRKVGRFDAFVKLQQAANLVRTWGDCYGYLLAATGRCDVMVDPRMHVWDAAALLPILTEAGGVFTDWKGEPTIYGGNGVATNAALLPQVLAHTRQDA